MKKCMTIMLSLFALPLMAEEVPPMPQDGGLTQMLTLFTIAMVFFYFILYRPEQKRRKAADEMRSQLKKGSKVTAIGIVGTVNQVKDNTVILNMVDGSKIEVLKAAITEVFPDGEEPKKLDQ